MSARKPAYEFEAFEIIRVVTVKVYDYAPAVPARKSGHPDNWEPGEPEDLEAEAVGPDGTTYELDADERTAVIRLIQDQWDCDREDRIEAARDAREDR